MEEKISSVKTSVKTEHELEYEYSYLGGYERFCVKCVRFIEVEICDMGPYGYLFEDCKPNQGVYFFACIRKKQVKERLPIIQLSVFKVFKVFKMFKTCLK